MKGKRSIIKCSQCRYHTTNKWRHHGEHICPKCQVNQMVQHERIAFADIISWLKKYCVCAYCGRPANEREHVIPKCTGFSTYILPSCGECNRLASGTFYWGYKEKLQGIKERRQNKYQKILKMPEHTEEELNELSGTLKAKIISKLVLKEIILQQLSWDMTIIFEELLKCKEPFDFDVEQARDQKK